MNSIKSIIHTGLEVFGANHIARFLTRKQSRILMYHRIIDHPLIPAITPAQFEKQLAYLSKHFNVMPVEELLERRRTNTLLNNSIALTFDDGHFDFYENAWPLLKKYNLPATLYITTGFIEKSHWLWPDLIKYILFETRKNTIIFQDQALSTEPGNILKTWDYIATALLKVNTDERIHIISKIAAEAHVNIAIKPHHPFNGVTWEQLKEMVKEGLDVGSHTHSHPILSSLDSINLRAELTQSKQILEKELGIEVSGICYPNGMVNDIDSSVESESNLASYQYGLVAYQPNDKKNIYRVGRIAADKSFKSTIFLINGYKL